MSKIATDDCEHVPEAACRPEGGFVPPSGQPRGLGWYVRLIAFVLFVAAAIYTQALVALIAP